MIFDGRSAQPTHTHNAARVLAETSSRHPLSPLWDEKRPSQGPELASHTFHRERNWAEKTSEGWILHFHLALSASPLVEKE